MAETPAQVTEDLWSASKQSKDTKLQAGLSVTGGQPALFLASYRKKGKKWVQDGRVEAAPNALNQVLSLVAAGLRQFEAKKAEVLEVLKDTKSRKRKKRLRAEVNRP